MAAKMKMLKLLQEIRGLADFSVRRPQTRPVGLFLVQMRSHVSQTTLQNRKRHISIDSPALPDIPHPVRINHIRARAARPELVASR